MIKLVVVGIQNPGNIGAIARVMKNFGLNDLILINPECDPLSKEALDRSKHAKAILKKSNIVDFDYLKKFDYVIGTTSKVGSDYNIPRVPITPEQFALTINKKAKTALLFGRESHGLTNHELELCDFIVTIPTSKTYPAMNISHAVAIVLYELFKPSKKRKLADSITPMSKKEKEIILKKVDNILSKMHFATEQKRQTQRKVWKRLITKAMLTKREAFALLGFLRKLEK